VVITARETVAAIMITTVTLHIDARDQHHRDQSWFGAVTVTTAITRCLKRVLDADRDAVALPSLPRRPASGLS